MGRYPVTFAEYDKFAEATDRKKPNDNGWGRGNHPVIYVSYEDGVAYTEWLCVQTGQTYRLPSEAEWEYAARAGTETVYWWGNEIGQNWTNCCEGGSRWGGKQTSPVGSFEPNAFGLYDMLGNVWEWVADSWYDNYAGAPTDGRIWRGDNYRVRRGGAWYSRPWNVRVAVRIGGSSDEHSDMFGIRVVRVA